MKTFKLSGPKRNTVFVPPAAAQSTAARRSGEGNTNWGNHREGGDYSGTQWRALREIILTGSPLCQICGRIASQVHHIWPGPELFYDAENLAAICEDCHAKVTSAYRRKVDKSLIFGDKGRPEWYENRLKYFAGSTA
jgi:5-methylcytosine-specific restriction endonuclease McrA